VRKPFFSPFFFFPVLSFFPPPKFKFLDSKGLIYVELPYCGRVNPQFEPLFPIPSRSCAISFLEGVVMWRGLRLAKFCGILGGGTPVFPDPALSCVFWVASRLPCASEFVICFLPDVKSKKLPSINDVPLTHFFFVSVPVTPKD